VSGGTGSGPIWGASGAVLTLFTGYVVHAAVEVFENDGRRTPDLLLRAVRPVFGELMLVGFVTGAG